MRRQRPKSDIRVLHSIEEDVHGILTVQGMPLGLDVDDPLEECIVGCKLVQVRLSRARELLNQLVLLGKLGSEFLKLVRSCFEVLSVDLLEYSSLGKEPSSCRGILPLALRDSLCRRWVCFLDSLGKSVPGAFA